MTTVSLCVVARNEEKFLPRLLENFKLQTYNHESIEVVLIDSVSTDSTRKIMEEFKAENKEFRSVIVADNPKKVQASGWNLAISLSTGDVIIRIDAHSYIPEDFVQLNVCNIEKGEFVSGGIRPCVTENETPWGKTLLAVENSLFGSSINKCRTGKKHEYVKTVFHGAYRREVFSKAGLFNERLLRTEDNEMHYRIRKAGYKICLDPQIVSYQYARSNFKTMMKQKFENGRWIGLTLGVSPKCLAIYHFVPACFVIGIILTSIIAGIGIWQLSSLMWILYGLFAILNTIISIKNDGFLLPKLIMPILFLILHISYGVGTMVGLCRMPFIRKDLI